MKIIITVFFTAFVSGAAYSNDALSSDLKNASSDAYGSSEIYSVGGCSFVIDGELGKTEYRLGYARDEYATYVTQLHTARLIVTVALTLGCASDDNEDLGDAMGSNENVFQSSREGIWFLSKKATLQKDPKMVIANVKNGLTRGYVLMSISEKESMQSNMGFCVTDKKQVLCGGAPLSSQLLQTGVRSSLVELINRIKFVPPR